MIKLGTLLGVLTTTSSAVVAPYANINISPKEYGASSFATNTKDFLEVKYGVNSDQLFKYNFWFQEIFSTSHASYSPELQVAVEEKIEESYLSNPFYDKTSPIDLTDMRVNIADLMTDWFDNNPSWTPGNDTSSLVTLIENIVVGSPGETFNVVESRFDSWISDMTLWGARATSFGDVESAMQVVTDNSSSNPSDFYMDISTFYRDTSTEIMNGQNVSTIESDIINALNTNAMGPAFRLTDIQFNAVANTNEYWDMYAEQEARINAIMSSFNSSRNIETASTLLMSESQTIYQEFVDRKIDEIQQDMTTLLPLATIGDSTIGATLTDMTKLFDPTSTSDFLSKYQGVDLEFDVADLGNLSAQITMKVLDASDAIVVEEVFVTNYESDVYQVENILDTINWQFSGKDTQHLIDEGIVDDSIALTNDQLDVLYEDYIQEVVTAYPSVSIDANWTLTPDLDNGYQVFEVTFDIEKTGTTAQVIRTHIISNFDDEFQTTLDEIRSTVSGTVISELFLKMNSITSNIDATDQGVQLFYFGDVINISSPDIVIDSLVIEYDETQIYAANQTKVLVSLTNARSGNSIVDQEIQIGITTAVDEAAEIVSHAEFQKLYKEYLPDWALIDKDIRTFIFKDYKDTPELEWIYYNMLTSVEVSNHGVIDQPGTTTVALQTFLTNGESGDVASPVINTLSLEYGLPIDEAYQAFSAYEFNDPEQVDNQLAAILDTDNPTVQEMDTLIVDFETNTLIYTLFVLDVPMPITVDIGAIQNLDTAASNTITLTDVHGNTESVLIQYNTNLVSGLEIAEYYIVLEEHVVKIEYILDQLVLADNIRIDNYNTGMEYVAAVLILYSDEAQSTTNNEWEEFKDTTLVNLYTAFGTGWSGPGTNTDNIVEEIHADYNGEVPADISERINTYIIGITASPIEVLVDDFESLDEIVEVITSLNKTIFLIEPIEVDFAGKVMIFVSSIALAAVSGIAALSTIRIIATQVKLKKLETSTVRYTTPKKLITFTSLSAIASAGGAAVLMVYIFITKGGL